MLPQYEQVAGPVRCIPHASRTVASRDAEVTSLVCQWRLAQPVRPDSPGIEPEDAADSMVDRRGAVGAARMRARLRHHAVAIGDQVDGIRAVPRDIVLLERLEPVVEDLGVGSERVRGVRALDRVLVQIGDCRFDQLPVLGEEKREPGGTRLAKRKRQRLRCHRRQARGNVGGIRQ